MYFHLLLECGVLATVVGFVMQRHFLKRLNRSLDLKRALVFGLKQVLLIDLREKFTYLFAHIASFLWRFSCPSDDCCSDFCMRTPTIEEPKIISFSGALAMPSIFSTGRFILFSLNWWAIYAVILTIIFSYLFAALSFYVIEPLIAGKFQQTLANGRRNSSHQKSPIFAGSVGFLVWFTLVVILITPQVSFWNGFDGYWSPIKPKLILRKNYGRSSRSRKSLQYIWQCIHYQEILSAAVASDGLKEILPDAQIDGQVSRKYQTKANALMLWITVRIKPC